MTNTEYMSYQPRVERVVQRLMGTALKDLKGPGNSSKAYFKFITDQVIPVEGLSAEKFQDMTYIELACLIDNIGNNPEYDWPDHDSFSEQLAHYECVACILFEAGKVFIPAKMFLALPIDAFYVYLARISTGRGKYRMCKFHHYIKKSCNDKDGYTIKDFLLEKLKTLHRPWQPFRPIADYEKKIRSAHQDMGKLLINSFHVAFPDKFHIEDIRNKYHAYAKEEY